MLIFFLIFVCVISVQYIMKKNNLEHLESIEEAQAAVSPEQLKLQTMLAISEIVLQQFIENIILNIEITPMDDKHNVTISLQATEFLHETTLLKDSYNLLNELQHVEALNDVTLKWFRPVQNKNTEVFTLAFDAQTLQTINEISYKDIPQAAKQYIKHAALN